MSRSSVAARSAASASPRRSTGEPRRGGTPTGLRAGGGGVSRPLAATLPLDMTSANGRPVAAMCASAAASAGPTAPSSAGKRRHGISMVSSWPGVMRPISSCWGSSAPPPGSPRHVTMSRIGRRNGQVSEVSGLTALPRPEFWNMATARTPPSSAPAAIATASPSLAAPA